MAEPSPPPPQNGTTSAPGGASGAPGDAPAAETPAAAWSLGSDTKKEKFN